MASVEIDQLNAKIDGLTGPGSISLAQLASAVQQALCPTGTIMPWAGTGVAPSGWLLCDGYASYSTTTYAALFAVIGYTYGGSGANFAVPQLQDVFIRGLDNMGGPGGGRGLGLAGARGTEQGDAFQGHFHATNNPFSAWTGSGPEGPTGGGSGRTAVAVTGPTTDGVNGAPNTAAETRPRNQAMSFIIKT